MYPAGYPVSPMKRDETGDLLITGQVGEENESAVHTGADVPLSAFGAASRRFHGVMDNTDVFFAVGRAVRPPQSRSLGSPRRRQRGGSPESATRPISRSRTRTAATAA